MPGFRQAVVLASSAKPVEVDHYLDLLDARELIDGWTTSGVLTGGFSEQELRDAGAARVYRSLAELRAGLEGTPFKPG